MRIKSNTVNAWLEEDLPYFDLTTELLGVGEQQARMTYHCRHAAIVCGTEEAALLVREAGAQLISMARSGDAVAAEQVFFVVEGSFAALNEITKVIQNIFEYASGVATRTQQLVSAAKQVNPAINVLTTQQSGHKGIGQVSLEQLLTWQPDYFLTQNPEFVELTSTAREWQALRAVQAGRVYCAPKLPFGWLDGPPGVNRLLRVLWLMALLEQRLDGPQLKAEVAEFFQLFYRSPSSPAQLLPSFAVAAVLD